MVARATGGAARRAARWPYPGGLVGIGSGYEPGTGLTMASRELIVLGTASQVPTRYRSHNSYALRWDDILLLFDPGEGTQRQCLLAGTSIARLDAVCITHFHGDHSLGLAGVIQRRALDNRNSLSQAERSRSPQAERRRQARASLPVCFPADGEEYFERLRSSTIFHDTSGVVPVGVTSDGEVLRLGNCTLSARALDHRVTTYGYRLDEDERISFDRDALAAAGIAGEDVGRLAAEGSIEIHGRHVEASEVTRTRPGQSMAFVMDTMLCDAALELAQGVDLLVCESTFLHRDAELAERYRHLTARQAAELAVEAGARRLVLSHFSARYPDSSVFGEEAGSIHPDVVVAEDLAVFPVPGR